MPSHKKWARPPMQRWSHRGGNSYLQEGNHSAFRGAKDIHLCFGLGKVSYSIYKSTAQISSYERKHTQVIYVACPLSQFLFFLIPIVWHDMYEVQTKRFTFKPLSKRIRSHTCQYQKYKNFPISCCISWIDNLSNNYIKNLINNRNHSKSQVDTTSVPQNKEYFSKKSIDVTFD